MSCEALLELGPGFYTLRHSLLMGGLVDVSSQMAFIRKKNGRFLVLDTVQVDDLSPQKNAIDSLTQQGDLIDEVVAVHPFHTLYFSAFHRMFSKKGKIKFYGTTRHIEVIKDVPWERETIDILLDNLRTSNGEVNQAWIESGIHMSIPPGMHFTNYVIDDHVAGLFTFHKASKVLFSTDTIMYFNEHRGCLLSCVTRRDSMLFQPDILTLGRGVTTRKGDAKKFMEYFENTILRYDFDIVCTAHCDNKLCEAKEYLTKMYESYKPQLSTYHYSEDPMVAEGELTNEKSMKIRTKREFSPSLAQKLQGMDGKLQGMDGIPEARDSRISYADIDMRASSLDKTAFSAGTSNPMIRR